MKGFFNETKNQFAEMRRLWSVAMELCKVSPAKQARRSRSQISRTAL
jgi:hypothetical protein